MNTFNRRHFAVLCGASAVLPVTVLAQDHDHDSHHGDEHTDTTPEVMACSTGHSATPAITPYASDIPFDQAYIDTMIPHHNSVIDLANEAIDVLADDRLVSIAQAILDTQPGEIEQLMAFREEWYGSTEPAEMTDEMMMVTMPNMEDCSGDHDSGSHQDMMNLMDGEWLVEEFGNAENKDLAFIDLVIPHHEMAVMQSTVGLQLAEHDELRTLCQEVIDAQDAEINELKLIREEIS